MARMMQPCVYSLSDDSLSIDDDDDDGSDGSDDTSLYTSSISSLSTISCQEDSLIAPSSALLNTNDSYCGPSEPDIQPPMASVDESGMSQVFSCPCCLNTFAQSNYLWYHVNRSHIAKGHFPPVPFFKDHSRLICSLKSCRWSSHSRFKATGCHRQLGEGIRCGHPLLDPSLSNLSLNTVDLTDLPSNDIHVTTSSENSTSSASTNYDTLTTEELIDIALQATDKLELEHQYLPLLEGCVNSLLDQVVSLSIHTIAHVPRSCRPLLAKILRVELQHANNKGIWGVMRLLMFAKATLRQPPYNKKKQRYDSSTFITSNLKKWRDEGVASVWKEVVKAYSKPTSMSNISKGKYGNITRALSLAHEGHYGKAIQSLKSVGVASPDNDAAVLDIVNRHPRHNIPKPTPNTPPSLSIDVEAARNALLSFPKGSSPGGSRLRIQHLVDATCGTKAPAAYECLVELTRWLNLLLGGKVHRLLAPWLCGAPITALNKKNLDGFRPIAVGETFRRLVSRICCSAVRPDLPDTFIPYGQLGVGIPGGIETAIHTVRASLKKLHLRNDLCLLKVDFKNAFNECDRATYLNQIANLFPQLLAWVEWCYTTPAKLFFGQHRILSTSGVQQGDPLGPLLFSLTLLHFMGSLGLQDSIILRLWYLDDGLFIGTPHDIAHLFQKIQERGPEFGLVLNPSKCEVYWPSGNSTFPELHPDIIRLTEGVTFLGTPVWGTDSYISSYVADIIWKVKQLQSSILELNDPQVELHLLRSCLGIGKVNHILRTVQADLIAKELDDFDNQLRSIFSDILHGTVSENAWTQASLPFRLGGLGLRSASRSASAAYLASVNMSRSTMAHLLADIPSSSPLAGLEFELLPGEIEAKRQLENTLNMLIEHTPSQATYQAELDTQLFDILKSRLNIRDRARLLAVAADNSTSSWLKAVPIQSLGLTMPSSEFITSLKIWLGIPIFSPQPTVMCPCGQPVDIYGDHLLECNHGPFRIRRHDSLRDVVWHALLQDNTTVCREQRITGDCHDRPGDIYHPDFSNGKPSFFDISVRSSLQASSISQSSITAGVAGARGEMQKDEKHRQLVEENGGVFIPLVVESYGLWTPFAKKTLKSIALRTIVRSGLEVKMATRNLFEQLSIKLWSYNAKIILNILSLLPVNPLWDLP